MVSKRAVDSATSDVKDDVMERDADFQTYLLPFFFQRRDGGWIHTLLTEAENERMHLL